MTRMRGRQRARFAQRGYCYHHERAAEECRGHADAPWLRDERGQRDADRLGDVTALEHVTVAHAARKRYAQQSGERSSDAAHWPEPYVEARIGQRMASDHRQKSRRNDITEAEQTVTDRESRHRASPLRAAALCAADRNRARALAESGPRHCRRRERDDAEREP